VPENQPRYNVDMLNIPIAMNQEITIEISIQIVNTNKVTTEMEVESSNLINILT
jgi:hypothetical protein